MKKRTIALLLISMLAILQGCERTSVSLSTEITKPFVSTEPVVSVSLEPEAPISVEENTEPALLVGEKAVYYVDDETREVFRTNEDNTEILGAYEDNGTFFIVTVAGDIYSYAKDALVYLYVVDDTRSIKREVSKEYLNGFSFDTAYNGKAYFQYYDGERGDNRDVMVCYDPSTDTFTEDENYTNLNGFFTKSGLHYPGYSYSFPKMMKECGYVLLQDSQIHEAKIYNEAGECTQAFVLNSDESVMRVGECAFVTFSTETNTYFLYETETNEKKEIFHVDPFEIWAVKYVDAHGAVFENTKENGVHADAVKEYYWVSFDEISAEYLTTINLDETGAYYENRLDPKFTVSGNRFYFLKKADTDNVWFYLTRENTSPNSLEIADRHIALADYGTVEPLEEVLIDYDNGTVYGAYRYEQFELTKDVSWKDAFNAVMKTRNESLKMGAEAFKTQCDGYYHSSDWGMDYASSYADEADIVSLDEVSDNLVQLTTYWYEYYGGAHGYYGYSYLWFDTVNQKEVTMRDLITIPEDELRDIIAHYSVEYWKACGSDTPFYVEYIEGDADLESDMYAEFYEYASYDSDFHFGKDCVYVSYAPYVMGSYAAGYIDIAIPYSALGLDW